MSEDPVKTNLLELVAEALNGSLGQDRVQSLMEALHLFEDEGGTDGLIAIAKSNGNSTRVQRRALELLFSRPPNVSEWTEQSEAYDLAAFFISGDNTEMQREAIEVLVEKVGDTARIPSQLQNTINELAVNSQDPRTRKVAQEFIHLMLASETAGLQATRTALRVRLNEPDTIQRLQFGEHISETLPRAVDRHHGDFANDDWEMLADAGRELGVLPTKPLGPSLWWWPSSKSRRTVLPDIGLVGFLLPGLAAFAMSFLLGFFIRIDAQLNLTLPMYYGLISTATGSILGVLCVLGFPPISLYSHRKYGAIFQSLVWVIAMAITAGLAVFLMSVYTENRANPINRGFWETLAVLTLALALVRPVTLAAYKLGGSVRRRRVLAVLCGTIISLGVLMIGVSFGLEDGQTLELQALFVGGPIAAATATAFAMLDNYRPDRAAETTNTTGLAMISGATLAGIASIALVMSEFVQSPSARADASQTTFERLAHLGTEFSLPVPVRRTIQIVSQQSSAAMSADIEASDGQSFALNVTQEETKPLAPDVYDVCLRSRGQNCASRTDISTISAWRLLLEDIDARFDGRPSETKNVPSDFERITVSLDWTGDDEDAFTDFENLKSEAELAAIEEDDDFAVGSDDVFDFDMDEDLQYFLATKDAVIGTGPSSLRILGGSLVVRTIQDNAPRLTLVDGLTLRQSGFFSVPSLGLAVEDFVELDIVDADTLSKIERYLEIAYNDRLHQRLENQTLKTAIEYDLNHTGGLNPDQIRTGSYFLSTDLASDSGAGLFEVKAVLEPPQEGASAVILSRMLSGWSFVPSPAFCYRFASDEALIEIPQDGRSDALVTALSDKARQFDADAFFLEREPMLKDISDEYCPAFDSPQSTAGVPTDQYFAVSGGWLDQETLWLQTQEPQAVLARYADNFVDVFDLIPDADGLAGLTIRDPAGDLIAVCFLEEAEAEGCDDLLVTPLEQMRPLPEPQNGGILNFANSAALNDARIFASFERTFAQEPVNAETGKIGLALQAINFSVDTAKTGVYDGSQPGGIGVGSLIQLEADIDKATVLLGLYRDNASQQPQDRELNVEPDNFVYLNDEKLGDNFQLVLDYLRATARATEQQPPSAAAVEDFYDSISVPVLPRDTIVSFVKPASDAEDVFFESATSFGIYARTANDPPQVFSSTNNSATGSYSFSFSAPPAGVAQSFCFADVDNTDRCESLSGLNDPILMRPSDGQVIPLQNAVAKEDVFERSGQIVLGSAVRLLRWPAGENVIVRSDRDIVIVPYYTNRRSQSLIDNDGLPGGAGAGEEFEPDGMIGFCAMAYSADFESCPDRLAQDAIDILPERNTLNSVRTTDVIRSFSQNIIPDQVFSLTDDWQQSVDHQIRADEAFDLVLSFADREPQIQSAEFIAGSYETSLRWAQGEAPVAICVRMPAGDGSCAILFERAEQFELDGRDIVLIRSETQR